MRFSVVQAIFIFYPEFNLAMKIALEAGIALTHKQIRPPFYCSVVLLDYEEELLL